MPPHHPIPLAYPFISWHCGRTAPQAAWWERMIGAERTFGIAGFPPWAMTGVMRVRWMMEHEPDIIRHAGSWLLIEDYVNFRLCGVRATDPSMASCMLLLDQEKRDWSDELIESSGIPRRLLPAVWPAGTVLGTVLADAARLTCLRCQRWGASASCRLRSASCGALLLRGAPDVFCEAAHRMSFPCFPAGRRKMPP